MGCLINVEELDDLLAAVEPFVKAFEEIGIHSYFGADDQFTKFLDRNRVTPSMASRRIRSVHHSPISSRARATEHSMSAKETFFTPGNVPRRVAS